MKYGFAILMHLRWYCLPDFPLWRSKTSISCMECAVPLAICNILEIHVSNCGMWVRVSTLFINVNWLLMLHKSTDWYFCDRLTVNKLFFPSSLLFFLGMVQMNLTVPNRRSDAKWLAEPIQI